MSEAIEAFTISIPPGQIEDLHDRLRRTRWAEAAPVDDWSQGVPLPYLQDLCRHWLEDYDWGPARSG